MESSLFFGGSVVAAVVAGAIALFAPCCISFMLPAYFASAFQNRRLLVAMTFLFGAGVPLSAPVDFPGPVTALWSAGGATALAVVRDLETGRYSAFLLTVVCGG